MPAGRSARFAETRGRPDVLFAQLAAEAPALPKWIAAASSLRAPQAIANIPYGWRTRAGEPGLYCVGDQCGVIPSLAREEMAIAIASGSAARRRFVAPSSIGIGLSADRLMEANVAG